MTRRDSERQENTGAAFGPTLSLLSRKARNQPATLMPAPEAQKSNSLLGMDFKGRKFTLGSFVGEVEAYLPEKHSFVVKFNGIDVMEVDAATVLNLLVQQENEAKADESAQTLSQGNGSSSTTPQLGRFQSNSSINLPNSNPLLNSSPAPVNNLPFLPPMLNSNFNLLQGGLSQQGIGQISNQFNPALFPLQNPLNGLNNTNYPFGINGIQTGRSNFGSPAGDFGAGASLGLNLLSRGRFQEGMRRHRSTSQPQLVTEMQLKNSLGGQGSGHGRQKRRESLIERSNHLPQRNVHSIHENINFMSSPLGMNYPNLNSPLLHRQILPQRAAGMRHSMVQQGSLRPLATKGPIKPNVVNGNTGEATKAEIFKLMRNSYHSSDLQGSSLPDYATIEAKLETSAHKNATRLSTLRTRALMRRALEPVLHLLPVAPERYVVNCLINICPLCGSAISLNKLGSQINWFKHLTGCHGKIGDVLAARFEFFEINAEKSEKPLQEFDEADLNAATEYNLFPAIGERADEAPLEESAEVISKHPELIPFTKKHHLETLLLNNLVKAEILSKDSILLQEVLIYSIVAYDVAPIQRIKHLFPELLSFQQEMSQVSKEAFEFYVQAGHPNLLTANESSEEKEINFSELEELVKDLKLVKVEGSPVELDWRVFLFNKAIDEGKLHNCSIMVQEILVLSFFYFGFITQRTPKKFRVFGKLLKFFGDLYQKSCKCYDIYVGEGPTGAEHTRGKPVNPSKLIIQNYNHYGLSRKSLQRTLAKQQANSELQSTHGSFRIDKTVSRFGGKDRRGSVKRKNEEPVSQTRRRRSSILNYVPVVLEKKEEIETATEDVDYSKPPTSHQLPSVRVGSPNSVCADEAGRITPSASPPEPVV